MSRLIKINSYFLCLFFLPALFIPSCNGKQQEQKIVATVNDSQISLVEFQKEVTAYSNRQPASKITPESLEELLNTMIEKKLMIHEAMKKGLAEDKRFVETIKKFWEQTLIRELINSKNKEWADRLYVTEDEIQKQYQRMQRKITAKVAKAKNRELAEEIRQKMLKGERVEGEETIGPCFYEYEDVIPSYLQKAFNMHSGEVEIVNSDREYIIIKVLKKENVTIPSLKDMYGRIKESLLEQKKQKALLEWIEDLKNSSKISINNKLLTEASREE